MVLKFILTVLEKNASLSVCYLLWPVKIVGRQEIDSLKNGRKINIDMFL